MEHTQRDRKSIRTGLLRKTCLLLLFINGLLTVPVYAQEIRVNLVNKPLKRFIEVIEQQTDYKFFYEERQIDVEQEKFLKMRISLIPFQTSAYCWYGRRRTHPERNRNLLKLLAAK